MDEVDEGEAGAVIFKPTMNPDGRERGKAAP
jgi:hypothetical protein